MLSVEVSSVEGAISCPPREGGGHKPQHTPHSGPFVVLSLFRTHGTTAHMLTLFFLYIFTLGRSFGHAKPKPKEAFHRSSHLLLACLLPFCFSLNTHTTHHTLPSTAQATMGGGIITKSLGLLYLLSSAEFFAAARRMDATAAGAAINNVQQGHHHHVRT